MYHKIIVGLAGGVICPSKNVIYVQGDEFHCAYSKHKQLKCALKIDASE